MVQIILINIKEDKKNILNKKIYSPSIINKNNKYKIIFKSKEKVNIQFKFYEKLINSVRFKYNNKSVFYNFIPTDGILVSCVISNEEFLQIIINPIDICSKIIITEFKKYIFKDLNFKNIVWDNIFIINLLRRTDRKELMIKKLLEANIIKYEFIDAIDGQDLEIKNKFLTYINQTKIVSTGHYACLLSHIKAIKLAKERNYSNIMILEDDINFCDDFINKLQNLLIPQYDILYLGGIISKIKLFFNDWSKCNKIMGAYGYILSSKLFDYVIYNLEKITEYVDVFYLKHVQPNYLTIILNDYIKTNLDSSDTSKKSKKLVKRLKYII